MAKMSFEEWMKKVNESLKKVNMGLDYRDLPDCPYYDWYNDGMSAKSAARRAIKNVME